MIDDTDRVQSLESGLLTLTGGRCVTGNLIVSIPTNKLDELAQWSTDKLTSLFLHMNSISKYLKISQDGTTAVTLALPLACLADLRHASTPAVKQLTECLESVEHQQRGTISACYFLKPRNKTRSRMLKKQLGVKPSKKRPRIPLFKVVLMKTVQELHAHIDVSQLTADFCGILRYSHDSWMHLYTAVIRCIEGCHNLLAKLPSVKDKADLLQEYETDGQTSSQVQQLLADLIEKFHVILSESSLPLYLTLSKQTLFLLDHPSSDCHLSLVHPDLITGLRSHLHGLYSEMDQWNTDLEDAWRVTESRLIVLTQVHRHRERAKEIERKICEHYHPLLGEHPIAGKTLSQAELYRAHFTTSLYDPAKELLSQATEILEAVQRLKSSVTAQPRSSGGRHDSTITNASCVISDRDISDISKCLTTSIQPFTTQLQQLQQVYVSVHIFHLLFEKALIWYKKVLKFIPESLLQMCTLGCELSRPNSSLHIPPPSQEIESLIYMPSEWLGAVRVFLSRHPPPRQEHVDRIDENIPQLVDRNMRSQARSLALRLRLLQRILTGTRLPLKVVTAVLTWRTELFGSSQQEKPLGTHHPAHLTRDTTTAGQPMRQDNEKLATRGQLRPNLIRVPEKPPRNKKMSSLDREAHTRTRASSSHLVASISGPITGEHRGQEKSSVRKNSSKLLPRSKSVDFNFNSSSTDGSVFDYDKALVQAETMTDTARAKVVPRKSRSSIKEAKSFPAEDLISTWKDDHTFSDSSELLNLESRSHNTEENSDNLIQNVKKNYASEPERDKSKYGFMGQGFGLKENNYSSNSMPEPVSNASTDHSLTIPSKHMQQLQRRKERPFVVGNSAVSPSSDERFIRITLTPKQLNAKSKAAFTFGSEDVLATGSCTLNDETNIELNKGVDPYDTIVNKIRDISASHLTNIEKLKKVSELLSLSTMDGDTNRNLLSSTNKASKMSNSTVDLRAPFQDKNRQSLNVENSSFSFNKNSNQTERPIEVVQRMKKNLAKSMEELNLSTHYPQHSSYSSHEQNPATSDRHEGNKFRSEQRAHPDYQFLSESTKQANADRVPSQKHSDLDNRVVKHLSRDKENEIPHSWSDVESYSQGFSASLSSQDPTSHSKQSPSPVLDSSSNAADDGFSRTMVSRFIPDEADSLESSAPSDGRRPSVTRAAGPSLFSGRNFISPSFLSPASSMRGLNSGGHPEMTFDIEVDLEQDYQALEDLEILQTMQDKPISNEFSNYVSKAPRKQSSDHTVEKFKSDQRNSNISNKPEGHSRRSWKTGSDLVSRHKPEFVPEIRVSHLSEQWSGFAGIVGGGLSASHVRFDRLTTEADKESLSQEQVADSLRKTQQILEVEEARRFQGLHPMSDQSLDEDEGDELGIARGLSHTTSLDNGYGSWASKHMYSTSSDRDWRKLSTSSADSLSRLPRNMKINKGRNDDGEVESSDMVHDLPQIERQPTDTDLY